jgi:hypothetical protein
VKSRPLRAPAERSLDSKSVYSRRDCTAMGGRSCGRGNSFRFHHRYSGSIG